MHLDDDGGCVVDGRLLVQGGLLNLLHHKVGRALEVRLQRAAGLSYRGPCVHGPPAACALHERSHRAWRRLHVVLQGMTACHAGLPARLCIGAG